MKPKRLHNLRGQPRRCRGDSGVGARLYFIFAIPFGQYGRLPLRARAHGKAWWYPP